jgi:hypothetical protein
MAIFFANDKTIQESGSRLDIPGHIVQTVHTSGLNNTSTSSTSPVDFITSNPITLSKANNKVLIEINGGLSAADWGDGVWNLMYSDIIHVQSGSQLAFSGYNGEYTFNRRHMNRFIVHQPGSVGPHTYKWRFWCYQGSTGYVNGGNMDNTTIYIRLTEFGT